VAPADRPALETLLRQRPHLAARVRFHGRLPPRISWQYARGAWAGLALLRETPAFVEAMPSKVYEYLACGLPVLATDLPRQALLVSELGAGAVVSARDSGQMAGAVLRRWTEEPSEYALVRESAAAAATRFRGSDSYVEFGRRVSQLVRRAPAP
jgi:glycosyltransferase involved in cell wall biosynthesis